MNRESLRLYRDILRATRLFTWNNEAGVSWSQVLRVNARKEFEQAKHEKDPLLIARMLVVGRDCLQQTVEKYQGAANAFMENVDKTKRS